MMEKKWWDRMVAALAFGACVATVQAQEPLRRDTLAQPGAEGFQAEAPAGMSGMRPSDMGRDALAPDSVAADTLGGGLKLRLPVACPSVAAAHFPMGYYGGYWGLWDLHEGFNATLDMSVMASFGKNRFPGVGFGTGISGMYVHSLNDRWVLGAGGFYDRLSWGPVSENRFGINLLAGYKLTDRVSLYAYGSKAFYPKGGNGMWIPPMPWMNNFTERFGGMLHFKLSDAVSFSVSVEENRWNR